MIARPPCHYADVSLPPHLLTLATAARYLFSTPRAFSPVSTPDAFADFDCDAMLLRYYAFHFLADDFRHFRLPRQLPLRHLPPCRFRAAAAVFFFAFVDVRLIITLRYVDGLRRRMARAKDMRAEDKRALRLHAHT